jgi:hypothetical protein
MEPCLRSSICVRIKRNIFTGQSFVGFVVDEETMEQILLKGTSVFLSVTLYQCSILIHLQSTPYTRIKWQRR